MAVASAARGAVAHAAGPLMERRKPLKRGKPLSADVEKVREFMARGRGQLARSKLRPKRKRPPPEGPLTPWEWREAVFKSSGGKCMISGSSARDAKDRRFHAHHLLPKRTLRAHGHRDRVWDPRNGVLLRADVHMRRDGEPEIPFERLPACVHEFAAELDAREGTAWASSLLLRLYPPQQQEGDDGEG